MINDLLIEQEVLQLQLQLQDEMMMQFILHLQLLNLVMEGLEGLVNSSYRWMYSCVNMCVKEVLNRRLTILACYFFMSKRFYSC